MGTQDKTQLSRISKLFIDRDQTLAEEALSRRRRYSVVLRCGNDVRKSNTLQVAVLTAANIANRCFPGAVRIAAAPGLADAPLLLWPSLNLTFGQALRDLLGPEALAIHGESEQEEHAVVFGDADPIDGALRATFDGWIAKVGPADFVERLAEREYCALSGVLSASLAISELFLSFAEINIKASRRSVGLSLWRPDLQISNPSALGIQVEFLPRDLWVLGLGHLGNAYLWSLAALPYSQSAASQIFLLDFDRVKSENTETGLIFDPDNITSHKTRACATWLEARGFETRLVERRFDSNFRCRDDEPKLALCGFDSNPARRDLATAQFLRVVESGLGGTTDNFDTISIHTLPNPRPTDELWPDPDEAEKEKRDKVQERMAKENKAYQGLGEDECGRYDLAGESVAVPFVGTTAATLVLAEIVRLLHGGPAYNDIKMSLSSTGELSSRYNGDYRAQDVAGLTYCEATLITDMIVKKGARRVWIFGYGSLMGDDWEKRHGCLRRCVAELQGYRRTFNKASVKNWGTRDAPSPTLNLEKVEGGVCKGIAFEFAHEHEEKVRADLEEREGKAFPLEVVTIRLKDGAEVQAYVPIYHGKNVISAMVQEKATMVRNAAGDKGSGRDYVQGIADLLATVGIDDPVVSELWQAVKEE